MSSSEVASVYCSADDSFSKRDDAYQQYVEKVAPAAFAAYETCIRMAKQSVTFTPPSTVLPDEFTLVVHFSTSGGGARATLRATSSKGVSCRWNGNQADPVIALEGVSSATLNCSRTDSSRKSVVTLVRQDGSDMLEFPWSAFDQQGNPVDTLTALVKQNKELDMKLGALEQSMRNSILAVKSDKCPWGWRPYTKGYGRFIRGIDLTGKTDPDGIRPAESTQEDAIKKHFHAIRVNFSQGTEGAAYAMPYLNPTATTLDVKPSNELGDETRPRNIAVLFCEKDN